MKIYKAFISFFFAFYEFLFLSSNVSCLCRRVALIVIAAIMLLLTFLGFCKPLQYPYNVFLVLVYQTKCFIFTHLSIFCFFFLQYFQFLACSFLCTCECKLYAVNCIPFYSSLVLISFIYLCIWLWYFHMVLTCKNLCSLVITGWLLVAGTFILSGTFLLLHK